jgi:hypothetical protein
MVNKEALLPEWKGTFEKKMFYSVRAIKATEVKGPRSKGKETPNSRKKNKIVRVYEPWLLPKPVPMPTKAKSGHNALSLFSAGLGFLSLLVDTAWASFLIPPAFLSSCLFLLFFYFSFPVLGTKLRALHLPGKCSSTDLNPQSLLLPFFSTPICFHSFCTFTISPICLHTHTHTHTHTTVSLEHVHTSIHTSQPLPPIVTATQMTPSPTQSLKLASHTQFASSLKIFN